MRDDGGPGLAQERNIYALGRVCGAFCESVWHTLGHTSKLAMLTVCEKERTTSIDNCPIYAPVEMGLKSGIQTCTDSTRFGLVILSTMREWYPDQPL